MRRIRAVSITAEAYAPYGEIVAASPGGKWVSVNRGTAKRYNHLSALASSRPGAALNLCVFRCSPYAESVLPITLLEKHPCSTQVFLPMSGVSRYLVVTARGGDEPDLGSLGAFLVEGPIGVSYRPGIWHHPMVALEGQSDFACLVYEDGTDLDCIARELVASVEVEVPSSL